MRPFRAIRKPIYPRLAREELVTTVELLLNEALVPKEPPISDLTFEEAYAMLEELIAGMEEGDVPLGDLLDRFESGTKLLAHCEHLLGQAELRLEKLREDDQTEPFDPEGD